MKEPRSTLPDIIIQLFDGEVLRTITKKDGQMASGIHLGMLSHTTPPWN